MQTFRIAFKNVRRNPRRSILLGIAIALGFFILTIVNGFTSGATKTLSQNLSEVIGGQILIMGAEVTDRGTLLFALEENDVLQQALNTVSEDIASYSKRTFTYALLLFGKKSTSIDITGVDIASEVTFLDALNFTEGNKEHFINHPNGVLLPPETLEELNIKVGESLLIKARTELGQINVVEVVISGSISNGQELETTAYAHITHVNELVGLEANQFSIYGLHLKDLNNIDAVTERLFAKFADIAQVAPMGQDAREALKDDWDGTMYALDSINTILEDFVRLIAIIQKVSFAIFCIILLIIMVGLINSYRMIMLERTSEIGTMRAMGVQKAMIRNIFLWEALFIVFAGAIVGLALAFLTMGILTQIDISSVEDLRVISKHNSLYFYHSLPMIGLSILLLCFMNLLAVFLPARAAANLQPAEALRH